jgi:hypothetical protein
MQNQVLFSETQKFHQWWIWLILIGINGAFVTGILIQLVGGVDFGDNPMSDAALIISSVLSILLTVLFFTFRLETEISTNGISVRFFPFHVKAKYFSWDIIKLSFIRKYSPILEYGGWGLRGVSSDKAFNVSGNMGLQIGFNDGKKLLIGTRKAREIETVLLSLGKLS